MSGYATDESSGSNKRIRFSGSSGASPASGVGLKHPPIQSTPIEMAKGVAKASSMSLHPNMRKNLQEAVDELIQKSATCYRKEQAFLEMKNNPDKIPSDAMVSVTLHCVDGLETDQRFKDLAAETAEIVRKCRTLLRDPIVKVTELNALWLKKSAQKAFAERLPVIAKLVAAEEGAANDYSGHQAVADLMALHGNDIRRSYWLVDETFNDIYCKVNQLMTLPDPSPKGEISLRTPASTRMGVTTSILRGVGFDRSNNSANRNSLAAAAARGSQQQQQPRTGGGGRDYGASRRARRAGRSTTVNPTLPRGGSHAHGG